MQSRVIIKDISEIVEEFKEPLKALSGKKILITGANGMIPSYLADVFAKANNYLENPCKLILHSKNPTNEKSRLGHLISDPNVIMMQGDIGEPLDLKGKIDYMFHGASRANPISFKSDPIDTLSANVNGTRNLLEHAKKEGIEKFLFFSSSEVYGNPPKEAIPTSEEYFGNVNPLGDMACYAESKRFSETLCSSYFRQHGIDSKIARIFHTFGPGLRNDGKTLANMFAKGIQNGQIELKDQGTARRGYAYVGDTTRGLLQLLFFGKPGEAYNVGSDNNYTSVRDLAKVVSDSLELILPVKTPIISGMVGETIQDRMPNLSKIKDIGYYPKVDLKEAVARLKDHILEVGLE